MKIYGVIYKITNIKNGKVYIGQTHAKKLFYGRYECSGSCDIERVYNYHNNLKNNNHNYNKHLLYSISKYGFDSFDVDKQFDIAYSQEELDKLEIKYIKQFDSFKNGYNNNLGGSGNKGRFGELNSFYGKHHSEKTKQKLRDVNIGKKLTKEQCKKLSECNIKYWLGKHHTEETKKKLRESHLGKYDGNKNPMYNKSWKEGKSKEEIEAILLKKRNAQPKKKVICITTNKIFNSILEGAKEYKLDPSSLSKHLLRKRKFCGKVNNKEMIWFYYDEYKNMSEKEIKIVLNKLSKNNKDKTVICITTNKVFKNAKEGARYYNCCYQSVNKCCKGKQKTAGQLEDGTKLVWSYFYE